MGLNAASSTCQRAGYVINALHAAMHSLYAHVHISSSSSFVCFFVPPPLPYPPLCLKVCVNVEK